MFSYSPSHNSYGFIVTLNLFFFCARFVFLHRQSRLITGTSRMAHLDKLSLKFSSFVIRLNLLHPQPSSFHFGLLLPLWCFSTLVNYYFKVSFDLKKILYIANSALHHAIVTIFLYSDKCYNSSLVTGSRINQELKMQFNVIELDLWNNSWSLLRVLNFSVRWNGFFLVTCVHLRVNLQLRLVTQRKSVREFTFQDLHLPATPFGQGFSYTNLHLLLQLLQVLLEFSIGLKIETKLNEPHLQQSKTNFIKSA